MSVPDAKRRILVVEDDPSISLGLRMNLEAEGYEVLVVEDGLLGLEKARETWDLLILDVMLPRVNGFEIIKALRAERSAVPVIMLSARHGEMDKVLGLELGAEDYITKPFSLAELLARVRVALRRGPVVQPAAEVWRFGDIVVDPATHVVTKSGAHVELTTKEFEVLLILVRSKGRVLSRQQIVDVVWGPNYFGSHRSVDNFLAQLRGKLEDDPQAPKHLVTVRGVGYRFVS